MILLFVRKSLEQTLNITKQKMKFSIKDFFSKCDQIRNFCAVIRTDSLVKTCSRFKSIVEEIGAKILPRIHFKFPEKVLQKLLRRSNKSKSVFKINYSALAYPVGLPNLLISL